MQHGISVSIRSSVHELAANRHYGNLVNGDLTIKPNPTGLIRAVELVVGIYVLVNTCITCLNRNSNTKKSLM